jgi:hypothetical protein
MAFLPMQGADSPRIPPRSHWFTPVAFSFLEAVSVLTPRLFVVLAVLAFVCPRAVADVLVRSCDAAGASCAKWAWVLPPDAKAVQVNRASTPFVALTEVLPAERVASCYDDPGVKAGSSTVCAARVPGRTDLWQLKSVLYPAAPAVPKSILLTVDAANPQWTAGVRAGGRPVFPEELPTLGIRIYGAPEGQPPVLLTSAPWAASATFRRESQTAERWCFTASLTAPANEESPQSAPWCGSYADPAPVLHLAPPNGITGQAPAP